MAHRSRPEHKAAHPVHLTLRARKGLPSLRGHRVFQAVRGALAAASNERFRVLHFSVQGDHVHLIVEATDRRHLASGAKGLSVRAAKAINRACARKGAVWGDRYHTRELRTPREVRHAIVYVLMNVKKHHPTDAPAIDPCSSAPWFDGFLDIPPRPSAPPTHRPRSWLAAQGWRRHGLISAAESPKPHPRRRSAAESPKPHPRRRSPAGSPNSPQPQHH